MPGAGTAARGGIRPSPYSHGPAERRPSPPLLFGVHVLLAVVLTGRTGDATPSPEATSVAATREPTPAVIAPPLPETIAVRLPDGPLTGVPLPRDVITGGDALPDALDRLGWPQQAITEAAIATRSDITVLAFRAAGRDSKDLRDAYGYYQWTQVLSESGPLPATTRVAGKDALVLTFPNNDPPQPEDPTVRFIYGVGDSVYVITAVDRDTGESVLEQLP